MNKVVEQMRIHIDRESYESPSLTAGKGSPHETEIIAR